MDTATGERVIFLLGGSKMTIKVHSSIPIYERSGDVTEAPHKDCLTVQSHWNRNEFVILHLAEEMTITVNASDLCAAIQNAQNSNKFG